MASVVPLRGLVIFLCLLHLCVQGIQDVNTVCLAKMTQYFYDKVQPKTKEGADAQYALSIYLPPAYCVDSKTEIKNKFDNDDAAQNAISQERQSHHVYDVTAQSLMSTTCGQSATAKQDKKTRVRPEVELIGLKVVAMEESAKQKAETRLRPKVELIELKVVAMVELEQKRQMTI
ncbi:hypothetical protein ROHU_009833 [Labeo rohita]|uniref:Uncharacterized protein n=1 Tax=Labeo rohita TaxID=84645 RepID=A0A498LY89_LABRO|nr:hypothetical protein ROHU_009833 [Labeo rohita]